MSNVFEYSSINDSVTYVFQVGVDLEAPQGRAVKLTETGIEYPAAGEAPAGIVLLSQGDELVKKGDELTVQLKDIGLWKAGSAVEAGDELTTDADGMCCRAIGGNYVFARALESATESGDLVKVQIINAGYKSV